MKELHKLYKKKKTLIDIKKNTNKI